MIPQELKSNFYFKRILKFCSLGIRSESEVLAKVNDFEIESDLKDLIIKTLKTNKFFFSDEDYIDRFLENISTTKGYSKIQLKQKLLRKGVPSKLVSDKVDKFYKVNEDLELEKFIVKNLRKLQAKEPRLRINFRYRYEIASKILKKFNL